VPALEQFLGCSPGLSSASVTRLTKQWQDDHAVFQQRHLKDRDFVYVWADGVHPKVWLGQAHSCVLVLLGVRLDGAKELIAHRSRGETVGVHRVMGRPATRLPPTRHARARAGGR
jgi:transposase-like protein